MNECIFGLCSACRLNGMFSLVLSLLWLFGLQVISVSARFSVFYLLDE